MNREKLQELVRRGIAPYAYRFDRSGHVRPAHEAFAEGDETVHRFAGRLVWLMPPANSTYALLGELKGRHKL